MPPTPRSVILDAILSGIQLSGYSSVRITLIRQQPARFTIATPDGTVQTLAVYAWTLTPGGRPQLVNEYRIQMTSVESPLTIIPSDVTILLGYEPNLQMFAGFDLNRHRTFTTGSPSIQVDIRVVRQALQDGLAFSRKTNSEIALGIRPDQLMAYALNAEHLHRQGRNAAAFDLLTKASALENIPIVDIEALSAPRQRIVQKISRLARSGNFRQAVMQAYDYRCAVTRVQLRLVDAAHILPVGAPGSVDDVRNGIALSPTYHRALDNGLIYLNRRLEMRINPRKLDELQELQQNGGIETFGTHLGRIHLPPDRRQWPNTRFISHANQFRNIS